MTLLSHISLSMTDGFDWSARATGIFAAATALAFLLRKRSASTRHLVWSAALLGSMLLPLVKWTVPGWEIPTWSTAEVAESVPDSNSEFYHVELSYVFTPTVDDPVNVENGTPQGGLALQPSVHTQVESTTPATRSWDVLSMASILAPIVWMGGIVIMLAGVAGGAVSLWWQRLHARPFPPEMARQLKRLTSELRVRRPITGLLTKTRAIPMTWGALCPVVLLPEDAIAWTAERRRMVLLHELAHVQCWDFVVQLLGQVARAIHWFNPMAWWAFSRMRLEQERACDDIVLNAGACAVDYASELVAVTRRAPQVSWANALGLAISRFGRIEQRLSAILDTNLDRSPLSTRRFALLTAALAVIVSLIATPRSPLAVAEQPGAVADPQQDKKAEAEKKDADKQPQLTESTLNEVREILRKHSAGELDDKRLTEGAIKGMLESLQDPHTTLLTANDILEVQTQIDGRIVGIGAQLTREQDSIVIVTPLPNSPAAKAGLLPRDEILSVGGTKLTELKEVVTAIRGPQGSEVKLRIRRAGQEMDVTVKRDVVPLPTVKGLSLDENGKWNHWLDSESKLGYVQITEFSRRAAEEVEETLAALSNQGLKGLILDLRGCPGGLLDQGVKVAGYFLKAGTVATIRSHQQPEQKLEVEGTAKYPELPLVVLVDDITASSAEVLAAALQDNQRGITVGERTFGKGSVQTLVQVSGLSANLKITTAQIHRPNGAMLHRAVKATNWGVDPTDGYFVPLSAEQRTAFRDWRAKRDLPGAPKLPDPLTLDQIKSQLSDPALAAAAQALTAKLKTGEFEKTGRPLAEMQAQLTQRDTLRQQRDELLRKLKQVEQQLQ